MEWSCVAIELRLWLAIESSDRRVWNGAELRLWLTIESSDRRVWNGAA